MTYLDVLTKHGYKTHSNNYHEKISVRNKHVAATWRDAVNLYSPAGGYNLSGRTIYNTGYIKPTPEQLDVIITVLTAE